MGGGAKAWVTGLTAVAMACGWLSAADPPPAAIARGPVADRRLALVFTGHEYAEGGETIVDELARHKAKASFFLTGEKAGFRSPAPRKPFDLKDGGFGAIELAGRYGELRIDEAA